MDTKYIIKRQTNFLYCESVLLKKPLHDTQAA